jgi:hypothetical protein
MFDVLDLSGVKDVFVLAQYWENPTYREYYCSRVWDTVILDNALYENNKPVPFNDMLQMARQIKARQVFVVGPEQLNDGVETGRMTIEILEGLGSSGSIGHNINLMCILHEKPNEMLEQYKMIKKYDELALGISIFSYRLGYHRGDLAKFLKLDGDERYIHAFGWDNLLEMYSGNCIFSSTDSSMAATAALNRINLQEVWQKQRLPGKKGVAQSTRYETDFEGPISDTIKMKTLENIKFLRSFANDPWEYGYK